MAGICVWSEPMDFWKFGWIAQTEALHWLFGKTFLILGFSGPHCERSGKWNNKFDDLGLYFVDFGFFWFVWVCGFCLFFIWVFLYVIWAACSLCIYFWEIQLLVKVKVYHQNYEVWCASCHARDGGAKHMASLSQRQTLKISA